MNSPDTSSSVKPTDDMLYVAGWNSALEMISFKLTHDFVGKLEKDTLASFAVWIKQFKKKECL